MSAAGTRISNDAERDRRIPFSVPRDTFAVARRNLIA